MAANGDGKMIALCDFLEPKEDVPDHSREHVSAIMSSTKPLNDMAPENIEKLRGPVENNGLMPVNLGTFTKELNAPEKQAPVPG